MAMVDTWAELKDGFAHRAAIELDYEVDAADPAAGRVAVHNPNEMVWPFSDANLRSARQDELPALMFGL